jgi:hypothetical protein
LLESHRSYKKSAVEQVQFCIEQAKSSKQRKASNKLQKQAKFTLEDQGKS